MNFTQQHISLIFIVILNAVTLFIVVSECLRVSRPFLRATAWAQGFAMVWHLCTLWMVLIGYSEAASLVSALSTWLYSLGFLAAVLILRGSPPGRGFVLIVGLSSALVLALGAAGMAPVATLLWLGAAVVLLVTPVLTFGTVLPGLRAALIIIQLSIAACFAVGFVLVLKGLPELGGTLYLINALLIPSAVQVFFQHALRLSTNEMEAREVRYRELFDSVLDAYFWLDDSGNIVSASPSFDQFGYPPATLVAKPLHELFTDPAEIQTRLQEVAEQGRTGFQATICSDNGDLRECEVSIHRVKVPGEASYTGTIRDVTERNQLERQFLDAQRRESLGVLAGGVAHDFNNLLQGITSHAEFLRDGRLSADEQATSLQAILGSATTASTLCNRLLQYTGKAQLVLQPVRIADTLVDLANMLKVGAKEHSIQLDVQDPNLVIDADDTLVRQVLLNLLQNALDASHPGDPVTVVLRKAGPDAVLPGAEVLGGASVPQPCVCIDVIDTGHGMAATELAKIFDPFYSTKEQGHGLGLSAVLGIIRRHKGIISVRSAPGQGSHFRLALPLSSKPALPKIIQAPVATTATGQLVLVVDDSDAIRDVASQALQMHGYRVLQAKDGVDALRLFRANRASIDLVLSDINMPNLDGFGLLRAVRDMSQVPFVLTSGLYTRLDDSQVTDSGVAFLPKPFMMKALLAQVGQSLQGGSGEVALINRALAG